MVGPPDLNLEDYTDKIISEWNRPPPYHSMYVFNRNDVCLLYQERNRPLRTLDSNQDHKLMFVLLFSLKSLTAKMDPSSVEKGNLGVPQLPGEGCSFHCFHTNTYKLSFMESPSGIKISADKHALVVPSFMNRAKKDPSDAIFRYRFFDFF